MLSKSFRSSVSRKSLARRAQVIAESLEGRQLFSFAAQVNFQPAASTVPAGYVADAGQAFAARGNGLTYGWDADNALGTRDRNAALSPDQRYDTFAHTQLGGSWTWEIGVPSGTYFVRVVAGDALAFDSTYRFEVENAPIVDAVATTNRRWVEGTSTVTVSDGRLTLTNAAGAVNNKLAFVEIVATEDVAGPLVRNVSPGSGSTNVSRNAFVGVDLYLPGGALDPATVNASTVTLKRTSDGVAVAAQVNTSGGGDSIVLQPTAALAANTKYTFTITPAVRDIAGGAMAASQSVFTTGTLGATPAGNIRFEKVALGVPAESYTSVVVGPDGKLYAGTSDGKIVRWAINAGGTLGPAQAITSLQAANGGTRTITGFAFDKSSTAGSLVMWVNHGVNDFENAPEWSGKLTRLSGPDLATVQDAVIGLPRSAHDHLSNQPVFGPDGALYFAQGSNTAQGAIDRGWGLRPERLLSAAILRVDLTKLTPGAPLNVQTDGRGADNYNPWPAAAPVRLYATGVRNGYDLTWTTDADGANRLWVPNNGSNAGGATPGTPALPIVGSVRIDGDDDADPANGMYNGPAVPALNPLNETQTDALYMIPEGGGGYYGHPNPTRAEFAINGGNPTAGVDPNEVISYPVGTAPDRNYRGVAHDFGAKFSPNGIIEYKGDAFAGALKGKLLVVQYSGGDDIVVLTRAGGAITASQSGFTGMTGFGDPLDLVEHPGTGFLYVVEYGGRKITLLRPVEVSTSGTWAPGPSLPVATSEMGGAVIGGKLYVVGEAATQGDQAPTRILDLATQTWSTGAARPFVGDVADAEHAVQAVNGKLYAIGALSGGGVRAVQIYDPATDAWSLGTDRPFAAGSSASAVIGGAIYVAGGFVNLPASPVARAARYTPAGPAGPDAWTELAPMPFARHSTVGGTDGQKLYVFGGRDKLYEATDGTDTVQIYDPATNAWQTSEDPGSAVPRMPRPARGQGVTAVFHNGEFYLFGGENSSGAGANANGTLNVVDIYNPATRAWRQGTPMPTARHATLPVLHQGKVYVIGGGTVRGTAFSNVVEVYTPAAATQPPPVPVGSYVGQDVGAPAIAGATKQVADGVAYDVTAAGLDVVGTSDQFHFVHKRVTGDFDMRVRVASLTQADPFSMAGLMARESLSANSRNVYAKARPGVEGYRLSTRGTTGGSTTALGTGPVSYPNTWLRLQRSGNVFTGYRSADGVTWTQIAQVTNAMPTTVYFGLAVSSRNVAATTTAQFRDLGVVSTAPVLPPAAPTGLTATATSGTTVALAWVDASSNETGFKVQRKTGAAGTYATLFTAPAGTTAYADASAVPGTPYVYRVLATGAAGDSGPSNEVTVSTPTPVVPPAAPAGLVATATSGTTVALTWTDASSNETGFRVERKTGTAGTYATLFVAPAGTNAYGDATAAPGTAYVYRVTATGAAGDSAPSNEAAVTTPVPAVPPAAASNLVATPASGTTVNLAWRDNASDETGFKVQRKTGAAGTFATLATAPANATGYADASAVPGTAYVYRVIATGVASDAAPSNEAAATTPAAVARPAAPTGLDAKAISSSRIVLTWRDNASNETGFKIFRSRSGGGPFTLVATVGAGVRSYTNTGLREETRYYYYVVATNAGGDSARSNVDDALTDDD